MVAVDYLPRLVDARIEAAIAAVPVVMLDGPRAVGKTTTAERFARSTIRLPADSSLLSFDAAETLRTMAPPVLVDEWQLGGTELLWTIKRIVDENPEPGQFILTGSVEPASYGPTYPLTGRAVAVAVHPMTASELAGAGGEPSFLARAMTGADRLLGASSDPFVIERLFTTGFPAARALPDPAMFLDGYAALVSQRAGDEGRDASRLLRTLRVLGVLTAQAVPDQRIWQAADINKATWKAYDDLLTRVHLAAPLPAWTTNRLKRLTSYPKRFLADTALALVLAGMTVEDLRADPVLVGQFLESFVAQQLRAQTDALNGSIHHLRTSGGEREIDMIVEIGDRRWAFEVKAGNRPDIDDARHLRWLHDEMGDALSESFVVHTGTESYRLAEKIWAVPVSVL